MRLTIFKAWLRETVTYDLGWLSAAAAWALYGVGRVLMFAPGVRYKAAGFRLVMRLHSSGWSTAVERRSALLIRRDTNLEGRAISTGLSACYDSVIGEAVRTHASRTPPTRIPGARLLVVKSASHDERGVIVVDYSYVFPLLPGLYDLARIADRYCIVLEPSWAGSCTPEILLYSRLTRPVFVQTIEPRDRLFIEGLNGNLSVVPIAANWWADPRLAPATSAVRDIDIAMVAAWADIKRHWRFFRALAELKRQGHRLTAALAGYRYDRTRDDIEAMAATYGVRDQITTHERISQSEVSAILARSKIHVLWSRRECANRAIIEAMLADTPVIVRDGLTFGFRYPYINEHTGAFVRERDLGPAMLDMIDNRDRYRPREWALAHMTADQATRVLENHLRTHALDSGEKWTRGLVAKTSALNAQHYWNVQDEATFADDYRFIESCRRVTGAA